MEIRPYPTGAREFFFWLCAQEWPLVVLWDQICSQEFEPELQPRQVLTYLLYHLSGPFLFHSFSVFIYLFGNGVPQNTHCSMGGGEASCHRTSGTILGSKDAVLLSPTMFRITWLSEWCLRVSGLHPVTLRRS